MLNLSQFYQPKLRVVAVTPGLAPGGAEIWLSTLINKAQTVKYQAIVATSIGMDTQKLTVNVPQFRSKDEEDLPVQIQEALKLGADLVLYWGASRARWRDCRPSAARC